MAGFDEILDFPQGHRAALQGKEVTPKDVYVHDYREGK